MGLGLGCSSRAGRVDECDEPNQAPVAAGARTCVELIGQDGREYHPFCADKLAGSAPVAILDNRPAGSRHPAVMNAFPADNFGRAGGGQEA